MGTENENNNLPPKDIYAEIAKRKDWFFECQLRKLNLDTFRQVNAEGKNMGSAADPLINSLINLISELSTSVPLGSQIKQKLRVYLAGEGKQPIPVWTDEERAQHDAFAATLIGRMGDFLYQRRPERLMAAIEELKVAFEGTVFASYFDGNTKINECKRKNASADGGDITHAISRLFIMQSKPWLIPELYNFKNEDFSDPVKWIENGEDFIKCFENEVQAVSSHIVNDTDATLYEADVKLYPVLIKELWDSWQKKDTSAAVKVEFWVKENDKYIPNIQVKTLGHPNKPIAELPFRNMTSYWISSCKNSILEVYVNKANSDMGLCHIMRTLYLFGTLPEGLGTDEDIRLFRKKVIIDEHFDNFFSSIITPKVVGNDSLIKRLDTLRSKLKTLFSFSKEAPRSAAIGFSPIAQEILKQAILRYKFWLDEPFRAMVDDADDDDKVGINKVREDFKIGDAFVEMEYWSENHYIMFCSSEYLAGQLWENETFQPAKDFLTGSDKDLGIMNGTKRKERGKARALKWLNNKLMFGWTEYNSHGYCREHIFALMNLVDFALDIEVRQKAMVVMDLLLFDITRFSHQGSMGAAGGRSQFKSKMGGRDNAASDAIEIILGTRGIFLDGGGEVGCSMATSGYKVPAVLYEIGKHPPLQGFPDKSRVSVGFDDAPKYGIQYSKKSDQKDSLFNGFAPKRTKHYPELKVIDDAIATHHNDYGAIQDNTVFWWTMSAYYNKQNVRNTFDCIDKYGLSEVPVFKGFLPLLVSTLIPLIEKFGSARIGASLLGSVFGSGLFGVVSGTTVGAAAGFFANKAVGIDLEENTSDDLSVFLEGSSRTRANIMSYRSRNFMLSSLQNFRPGQLNYQTSVNQATLSTEVSVFTTAALPGIEMSVLESGFLGGLAGASLGLYVFPAAAVVALGAGVLSAGAAAIASEVSRGTNPFGDDEDGPGWWTGYWALPMVVQHENVSILAYDFSYFQSMITRAGSHVWFPKNAFDKTEEKRTSSYEDDNFPLLDVFESGRKGFWIFGQIIQPPNPENPLDVPETYIGVFSNQPPDWLDKNHYFYKNKIKEQNETALEKIQDEQDKILEGLEDEDKATSDIILDAVVSSVQKNINIYISKDDWINLVLKDLMQPGSPVAENDKEKIKALADHFIQQIYHRITWKNSLPADLFSDKDWYVGGKNIWIQHLGSKDEYGSFDNFKEIVSKAKILVDDAGDMACTYHIPKPDGSTETLSLDYDDGGKFALNGIPIQTDLYPRFENHFVRGGLVEWGQREYVIEYNGKSLTHDFNNMQLPVRLENKIILTEDLDIVKGLVIYLKTENEEMEVFTVANATVNIGCNTVAVDEVIAAGKVEENTFHDAEWIFFDMYSTSDPDMTINIYQNLTRNIPWNKDSDTEWKMTFTLKALMGDRSLKPCTMRFAPPEKFYLRQGSRNTGPIPFSVQLQQWRKWKKIQDSDQMKSWMIAGQPGNNLFYFDYIDQLSIDKDNILWHRKLGPCATASEWTDLTSKDQEPSLAQPVNFFSFSTQPGYLFLFLISEGFFYARWLGPGQSWSSKPWTKLNINYQPKKILLSGILPPPLPVPLWPLSFIYATFIHYSVTTPAVFVSGMDGNIYVTFKWPLDGQGNWRMIETASFFNLLHIVTFQVSGNFLFAMDVRRSLWQYEVNPEEVIFPGSWEQLPIPQFVIESFIVAAFEEILQVIASSDEGTVWAIRLNAASGTGMWQRIGQNINFKASRGAKLAIASPIPGRLHIFIAGIDDKLYSTWWTELSGWENDHNWAVVTEDSQKFKALKEGNLKAISRVNGQIEIYATDAENNIWKNWWS